MSNFKTIRKLLVLATLAVAPLASYAGVIISVGFAPPVLPVYSQPICPGDGYLWTPGYWAYGPGGYYWVPGTWVQPPSVGLLWTPAYWGWSGGAYLFHAGYWGPHVGFYGGINYGFGYGGSGFYGGEWRGGHFAYNTAYSHVNETVIHNTYVNRVTVNNINVNNHTSFNGGNGGIQARPSEQENRFDHENHIQPTGAQQQHFQQAANNRGNFASANGGHPQMAATPRPGAFNNAIPARGAVPERANNQQQRIANGVGSGQMTARETGRVENREANIHQSAVADRQANGGALNAQQRQNLNARQNSVSNQIYQDKHNAAVQPQARPQAEARPQTEQRGFAAPRQQAAPAPRQQMAPRQEAPRPQAAAPHPQAAPHAEGGGHHR